MFNNKITSMMLMLIIITLNNMIKYTNSLSEIEERDRGTNLHCKIIFYNTR